MQPYFGLPLDRRSWLLLDLSGGVSHCSWYPGLPIPTYLIRDSSHPGPSFLRVSTWQCQYPAATATDGTGPERRYRSWLVLSRGTMSWCCQLEWRWKLSSRRQPHGCHLGVSAPLATIDPALGEKIPGDYAPTTGIPIAPGFCVEDASTVPAPSAKVLGLCFFSARRKSRFLVLGAENKTKRRLVTRPSRYFYF